MTTRKIAAAGPTVSPTPSVGPRGGVAQQFNMNEPAVPRPRREFGAAVRFVDDRRAVADVGSRGGLPARTVWALGGSSLA